MPPRFAYWTILIDNAPTAFRARDAAELLPTLNQLKRKNKDVVLKWFARGRLWESQQQERDDFQRRKHGAHSAFGPRDQREQRGKNWRPGGEHKDPRARFDKEKQRRDKREQRQTQNRFEKPRFQEQRQTQNRSEKTRFLDQRQQQNRPAKPPFRDQREGQSRSDKPRFQDRRPKEHTGGGGRPSDRHAAGRPPSKRPSNRPPSQHRPSNWRRDREGGSRDQRPDRPKSESVRNKSQQKSWIERPRRDDRREQPERKEQEPPPRRPERPADTPEPPPQPEQIVIKPEPPERG